MRPHACGCGQRCGECESDAARRLSSRFRPNVAQLALRQGGVIMPTSGGSSGGGSQGNGSQGALGWDDPTLSNWKPTAQQQGRPQQQGQPQQQERTAPAYETKWAMMSLLAPSGPASSESQPPTPAPPHPPAPPHDAEWLQSRRSHRGRVHKGWPAQHVLCTACALVPRERRCAFASY